MAHNDVTEHNSADGSVPGQAQVAKRVAAPAYFSIIDTSSPRGSRGRGPLAMVDLNALPTHEAMVEQRRRRSSGPGMSAHVGEGALQRGGPADPTMAGRLGETDLRRRGPMAGIDLNTSLVHQEIADLQRRGLVIDLTSDADDEEEDAQGRGQLVVDLTMTPWNGGGTLVQGRGRIVVDLSMTPDNGGGQGAVQRRGLVMNPSNSAQGKTSPSLKSRDSAIMVPADHGGKSGAFRVLAGGRTNLLPGARELPLWEASRDEQIRGYIRAMAPYKRRCVVRRVGVAAGPQLVTLTLLDGGPGPSEGRSAEVLARRNKPPQARDHSGRFAKRQGTPPNTEIDLKLQLNSGR